MPIEIAVNKSKINSLHTLADEIIDSIQDRYDQDIRSISIEDKLSIVKELDAMGFLAMRNAVNIISRRLNISRVCIYNWLNGSSRGRIFK